MGLIARILKSDGQDSSNGGLSSRANEVCIVNAEGPFEPSADAPAVLMVQTRHGNIVCVPADKVTKTGGYEWSYQDAEGSRYVVDKWLMFGGCYIETSDSRFGAAVRDLSGYRYGFPVALHDRVE